MTRSSLPVPRAAPEEDAFIRNKVTLPVLRLELGPLRVDPVEAFIGASLAPPVVVFVVCVFVVVAFKVVRFAIVVILVEVVGVTGTRHINALREAPCPGPRAIRRPMLARPRHEKCPEPYAGVSFGHVSYFKAQFSHSGSAYLQAAVADAVDRCNATTIPARVSVVAGAPMTMARRCFLSPPPPPPHPDVAGSGRSHEQHMRVVRVLLHRDVLLVNAEALLSEQQGPRSRPGRGAALHGRGALAGL